MDLIKGLSRFDLAFVWLGAIVLLVITLPLLCLLFSTSIQEFLREAGDPEVLDAVRVSVVTSTAASLLGLVFGVPLAYVLARMNFPGKSIVDTLVDLPMVLPPTVAGLALILFLGPHTSLGGMLRAYSLDIIFTWRAIILAQFFVSTPLLIRTAKAALEGVDVSLERAARSLGASRWHVFRTITLPLAGRGILAGWIIMWARAIGEFGATLMVSSNIPGIFPHVFGTYTLPTTIYLRFLWSVGEAVACAIILLIIAFAFSVISKRILSPKG